MKEMTENQAWLNDIEFDEAIVSRDGASTRTGDELKVQFITDAIDLIESLHDRNPEAGFEFRHVTYRAMRSRSLHAEEHQWDVEGEGGSRSLTAAGFREFIGTMREWEKELNEALIRDPQSGLSWFDTDENGDYTNTSMPDPGELDEDLTTILSDLGIDVYWEDGYIITRVHPEGCKGCDWGMVHDYMPSGPTYYSTNDILGQAVPISDGWKRLILQLAEGDTADSGTSTKWRYAGPGEVTYLIHSSGWTVQPGDTVRKQYI